MGLDLLEFTIAVEDAFGISIPDADAERLTTPGLLVDYLETRLHCGDPGVCLEQRAFHRLRLAGMQVLALPRNAFQPSVPWADLLHTKHHARQWAFIKQATGVSPWPRLKPILRFGVPTQTIGDTATYLATRAPRLLMREAEEWSRQSIEAIVTRLIAEELGVTEFQPSDRFVQDMGCD